MDLLSAYFVGPYGCMRRGRKRFLCIGWLILCEEFVCAGIVSRKDNENLRGLEKKWFFSQILCFTQTLPFICIFLLYVHSALLILWPLILISFPFSDFFGLSWLLMIFLFQNRDSKRRAGQKQARSLEAKCTSHKSAHCLEEKKKFVFMKSVNSLISAWV